MSSNRTASKARKSTINYHRLPLDKHQLLDPDAFLSKDRGANQSQSTQSGSRHTDRLFTTPQFVSALTGIWDLVAHPESSGTTDQRSVSEEILHKEDPVCVARDRKGHALTSCTESSTGLNSQTCLSTPKSIHEDLRLLKKILMLTSRSNMIGASATWRHMRLTSKLGNMHYQNICSMQTEKLGACATSSSMDIKEDGPFRRGDHCCSQTGDMPAEQSTSSSEEDNITYACENSLHDDKLNAKISREYSNMPACSSEQVCKEARIMLENQISSTCEHIRPEGLTCTSCVVGDAIVNPPNVNQHTYGEDMSQQHFVDKRLSEFESSLGHRFHGAVDANKHAAAGAIAGTVVSISLHPVDTVKTIIQANSSGQSSFYHIIRHTLVERGVLGLYGGLASKIACSAPISAIYTLTYEIVKGSLLPTLPKVISVLFCN